MSLGLAPPYPWWRRGNPQFNQPPPSARRPYGPSTLGWPRQCRRRPAPLGPGSEGVPAARPPGGLHAGLPSSHKVIKHPPLTPEVHAGWWPKASRTATSPLGPTKKGRAAGPRACSEEPAARRVATNTQLHHQNSQVPTNAKSQIAQQMPCCRAPANRSEPAENHLAPKTSTNHLAMRPAAQ